MTEVLCEVDDLHGIKVCPRHVLGKPPLAKPISKYTAMSLSICVFLERRDAECFLRVAFADGFPADVGEARTLEQGGVDFFDGEQRIVELQVADDVVSGIFKKQLLR